MVTIGISRKNEWGEYRVWYRENGRDDEVKAYYTEDLTDAVTTMFLVEQRNMEHGIPTQISTDQSTTRALYRGEG